MYSTPVYRPVSNPVNCPECGRHFKNNKALNGHMRLHGGFDWTKRICRVNAHFYTFHMHSETSE